MMQQASIADGRPRALTDPLVIVARYLLASRRRREEFLQAAEFGEPAWDMLLDLYVERCRGRRVSTHSLCDAAMVPASTALRWIGAMVEGGQLVREPDPSDRRRVFVSLTPEVALSIERYLQQERDRLRALIQDLGS